MLDFFLCSRPARPFLRCPGAWQNLLAPDPQVFPAGGSLFFPGTGNLAGFNSSPSLSCPGTPVVAEALVGDRVGS